ncbi:DM13 domain-containing protein [Antrihabitans stalactiti]|uniref:DM13 domain-containing protein n=1 Tax=Antrihabitans stalactiti TaxID=2584121 RepID=A0A848KG95_9NOCA|nr:DM13 domain-containing protein [Antrihabitans stalactiti]NMN95732.1 DM13 domain-containing protein [Antrihabitans stalactiti]
MKKSLLRPAVVLPVLAVLIVVIAAATYWFEPWKLVVNKTVDEAAPTVSAQVSGQKVEPVVVAQGDFISHEHETTGKVQLLRLPDGEQVLRIIDLDTSNGPLLKVWLTDAPVIEGSDGWRVFDDGRHEDLGELKGNKGSSNYPIPADADISGLNSVTIWCDRFHVSFGAATLT